MINNPVVPSERIPIHIAKSTVDSTPNLCAVHGTNGETTANASSGLVVKNPAKMFEIPRPSQIKLMIGQTTVSGIRKFMAINTMPMTSKCILPFN